jgi:hypothetical protein
MEITGQLHAPEIGHPVPAEQEWVGPRTGVGSPGKESFSPLPGIEPRFLFPAAHSPVSTPCTLSRHLKMRNAYTILARKSYGNEIGRLKIREVNRTGSENFPVAAFCKGRVQPWCSTAAEFSLSC